MNQKEELLGQIKLLEEELEEINKRERAERNKALVGKYFKYLNNYSCPKEDEYWWMYVKVTGLNEDGEPLLWTFQKAIDERIEISTSQTFWLSERWHEIDAVEFYTAWHQLTTEIGKFA